MANLITIQKRVVQFLLLIYTLSLTYLVLWDKGIQKHLTKHDAQSTTTKTTNFLSKSETESHSDILITSYMRSGSTFLGRVLGYRSDSFYVYEPLFTLAKFGFFDGEDEECHVFKNRCSKTSNFEVAFNMLQQIYNCSLYKEPFVNFFKQNINAKGPQWLPYNNCFHLKYPNLCLKYVSEEVCKSSKHRVTKVLRISVENSERLLQSNPNLKVVYLVRDPRAIINSHLSTKWSSIRTDKANAIEKGAKVICKRIQNDVHAARKLRSTYPDRFIAVQYEDFSDPFEKVVKLHRFLNLDLSKEVIKFLQAPKMFTNVSRYNDDNEETQDMTGTDVGEANDTDMYDLYSMENVTQTGENLQNMHKTTQTASDETHINSVLDKNRNVDMSLYKLAVEELEHMETGKLNEMNIHDISKMETGKLDEMKTHDVRKLETGQMDEMNMHDFRNIETAKLDEMNIHAVRKMETGKLGEMNMYDVRNIETGKLDEMNINDFRKIETAKVDEMNMHGIKHTETAKLDELNMHARNIETGMLGEMNMHDVKNIETGKLGEMNIHDVRNVETGKLDDMNINDVIYQETNIEETGTSNPVTAIQEDNNFDVSENNFHESDDLKGSFQEAEWGDTNVMLRTLKGRFRPISYKGGNHPFLYRETLHWEHAQLIDKHCTKVYKLLGYRVFNSEEELRDLSIPAVSEKLPFSI